MNTQILEFLTTQKRQVHEFLKELVVIQSGSHNKSGVDQVGRRIEKEMTALGFSCEFDRQTDHGNTLIARSPGGAKACPQILITGHMDTVFPEDTEFRHFSQDENHCYGPGVADMKGGLAVGIFGIKAALNAGVCPPLTFIFNSDEEIGSPTSREAIAREAKKSMAGLVLEAGGLNGEIVTGRKGNLSIALDVSGGSGHAAFAGKDKASAILELAHKTIAIEKINQPEKGISANVGKIEGGLGRNSIAQHARADVDFRFPTPEDEARIKKQISTIMEAPATIKGTRTKYEVTSGRPPMPQTQGNRDLYGRVETLAEKLNIPVKEELRQGVSDANIIASQGTPVIDGLGPCGAKDHSADEYILKKSLWDRTLLFAHILADFHGQRPS